MITLFLRHGVFSDCRSMSWLAGQLYCTGKFCPPCNQGYAWMDTVVDSGLKLANSVLEAKGNSRTLLIGHSQGGLVCRVAAVALAGNHLGSNGIYTERINVWRQEQQDNEALQNIPKRLAVVTIATPNAGAMSFGQMSVAAELVARTTMEAASLLHGMDNLRDLTTPRLFQEFENWIVRAKYLSISGVCVNRYCRGSVADITHLFPIKRIPVRFDLPNDNLVEDSSTDLRQSLIRPEVDLTSNYRHIRMYPNSISLNHSSVRESSDVVNVIMENLDWLLS